MNLPLVVALAVSFFLAFSIGLNLGLHGVLSVGEGRVPVRSKDTTGSEISAGQDVLTVDVKTKPIVESDHVEDKEHSSPPVDYTNRAEPSVKNIYTGESDRESDTGSQSALRILNDIYSGSSVKAAISAASISSQKGAIATYLQEGGKIPIVLLTCNRPEQLKNTLASLLAVRGVSAENLLIAQDGAMQEVADIVRQHGLQLLQNSDGLRLRGGAGGDGAMRIAKHYRFSLSAAFDRSPLAPAIIIAEDDLLFSPDFYEYLTATAPILEIDPTTFVVSAWNDNGFKGRVSDAHALKRTEFFPGLGWLLPRELYQKELESKWPSQHWDHWLRSVEVHGTRDIVYPEVPRTFHNGIVGTFMNIETHNKYFRDVAYNIDESIKWNVLSGVEESSSSSLLPAGTPNYYKAVDSVNEARVESLIGQCTHIKSLQELMDKSGVICCWVDLDPTEPQGRVPEFEPLSSFFGLWHEHRRGAHRGLHEFHWDDKYVLILNIRVVIGELNYKHNMPSDAVTINPSTFDKSQLIEIKRKSEGLEGYAAKAKGLNCHEVCAANSLSCREDLISLLNTCQALNEKFPCQNCLHSFGLEQPAYVSMDAPPESGPGTCVISTQPEKSNCEASHKSTFRLCACA